MNKNIRGQAVIEYILLFGLIAFISINMVKGFSSYMGKTVGGLGVALTNQLTVGVCEKACYYKGYKN
ncbi:MAG: hypothetical protein ISR65_05920 [Bacteriovoracaceae bacterium]|nr:hypothetical protein [Bacteriovoracaceae bacterium]